MASRTQIRLEQLTGSMAAPGSLGSKVALASLPAGHLGDVLDEMGQAIARIHGEKDFTNKDAGVFSHAQSVFNGEIRATGAAYLSGSAQVAGASLLKSTLEVTGNADLNAQLDVAGNVNMQAELAAAGAITFSASAGASAASDPDVGISGHVAIAKDMQAANIKATATLHADGEATLASAIVEDLTSGRVVLAGTSGAIEDSANLTFNGTLLSAPQAAFSSEMVAASAKISDLTSGRVVLAGASGEIEDSGNLAFSGTKLTVTGEQQVTSHMDIDGQLDAAGAVNFQTTLAVAGNTDLNGQLDVAGASNLAATGVLTDIRGTLSVDEAAVFDANVTISGNLTVAGSTTTVNTEEVTIADHNIVLDSNNSTGAVINGAGLTFEGGTGDDLTFQWNAGDSEMQLKLGASYADLEIKDLDAAGIVLSANLAAVQGSFSGQVSGQSAVIAAAVTAASADIAGTLEAAAIKIDSDVATRLYIVDGDGSMKDEAKLVFDQTKLAVTGNEEVSGYLRAAKLEIDSAADYIDVNNAIQLNSQHGAFSFMAGGSEFGKIAQDSGNMKLMSNDIEFAFDNGVDAPVKIASIDGSALSLLIDGTKKIEFNDAAEAIYSSGAELMLKSNSVAYAFPQADAAAADYVLVSDGSGQLSWKSSSAASSAAAKKINVKLAAPIGTPNSDGEYEYDYSGFSSAEKSAILAATNSIIDVYVNGQLLVGYKNGTPIGANADYDWNTTGLKILFAFALEIDDVITVIVR